LDVIIWHFDTFPLRSSKKQAAYAAWKDLVAFRGKPAMWRMESEQEQLTARLTSLNCRGRPKRIVEQLMTLA